MKFASIAFYIALSFILWYSEAFVVPRLVVSPALSTNKQFLTTAPPQHARVTALWDDPKGIYDVVFNAFPAALLVFAVSVSFVSQEKILASEKEKRAEVLAAEKENLAVWKAIQEGAIATERERQEKAFLLQEKAIAAEKESREKAIAAEKESRKEAIAAETARQDKAIATETARQDKAIAAEREDLKAALLQQNEIWSLRFENYAAKGEKFKKDDGLPPPSSPSDSKSE